MSHWALHGLAETLESVNSRALLHVRAAVKDGVGKHIHVRMAVGDFRKAGYLEQNAIQPPVLESSIYKALVFFVEALQTWVDHLPEPGLRLNLNRLRDQEMRLKIECNAPMPPFDDLITARAYLALKIFDGVDGFARDVIVTERRANYDIWLP
ncbi:hypothetical protein SAMN05216598_4379 [Pseudomonas asplenii]|uniref:Uncharacterized protein n=1 Tax=Pseudomonas asplenii TaxID=53407 RepID=A0A1H1YEG1_9PSED|nr:hypothetical protein SAMN05216598_4379 [Pseudomonas asplenii]